MHRRPLGRTDIEVPELCLGTMMYGSQLDERHAFEQMDRALDRGLDFFDTAEIYPIPPAASTRGATETIVGNWLASRGTRERVVLATKVTGHSIANDWLRDDGRFTRLTRDQIFEAVDNSLLRLRTDWIDLYQLHWPDRQVPLWGEELHGYHHYDDDYVEFEETLGALSELVEAGKVRAIGVSNETAWGVMHFLEAAAANGWPRMQSIQNAYSPINRLFEFGLAEVALQEDVGLLAYSPLGQGFLSGKYLGGATPPGTRKEFMAERLGRYMTPSAEAAIGAYRDIARAHDLDPAALALRWAAVRPWVTSVIFGASSLAQLDVAIDAMGIEWTDALEDAMNAVHAQWPNPCP